MRYSVISLFGLVMGGVVLAQPPVQISGTQLLTLEASVAKTQQRGLRFEAVRRAKQVALVKLMLNAPTQTTLARRIQDLTDGARAVPNLGHYPRAVQLGMNHVPVFDQGEHGTCMLFALTAALDAALGRGDYISQLCQLDLSNYLNRHTYAEIGWQGGWTQDFLNQMTMFGIVPKTLQKSGACAGRLTYPLTQTVVTDELSVFDYHQISESIQSLDIAVTPLILEDQVNDALIDREQLFNTIKSILNRGDRIICSVLLMGQMPGDANAAGSYHMLHDTWVLLPHMGEALIHNPQTAGHAFVITGYNDDAVALDSRGHLHKGLLTLRNSWGSQVGDHGDFYMTYAYFKAALLEAHQVLRLN